MRTEAAIAPRRKAHAYPVPNNQFDPEKFKARYALSDDDFKAGLIDAQLYVFTDIALPDDPPIFEAPSLPAPPPVVPEPQSIERPVRLVAGTARQGTAPITFEPGTLLTHPQLGAVEFADDGVNGGLHITMHVGGVLVRVRIA